MQYRRAYTKGGSYFFTLVTHRRSPILRNDDAIVYLRNSFRQVKKSRPFSIDAIVVLPDHLHCIWTLPKNDHDFSTRWRLIKTWFTKHFVPPSGIDQRKIWQNRYWEHLLRDEKDYQSHIDYIHYNPVKHGHVTRPSDWKYSSFQKFVTNGQYDKDWGASQVILSNGAGKE